MQYCFVYFDWVKVDLSGMQLTPAISTPDLKVVRAIFQINLFPLDTAVVFASIMQGIK